jgi:hypothetical protein
MGLSISYDTWYGSYSAFKRWRIEIAKLEDIPLELMQGFYEFDIVDHRKLIEQTLRNSGFASYLADVYVRTYVDNLPIKWSSLKRNPLNKLLYHSDCDGSLPHRSLKGIYERLEFLMETKQCEMTMECVGKTNEFIIGCKAAYADKKGLRFG